jgi:hypothetical protein
MFLVYGSIVERILFNAYPPLHRMHHENPNVRAVGQGEPRHRKYKRLKLGGGQAYDRSNY